MTFDEVLAQVLELLQRGQEVSYRGLKRRVALDDEYLEDLKFELITGQEQTVDKDDAVLVWVGDKETTPNSTRPPAQSHLPTSYTPPHLAERIRAEQVAIEARGVIAGEHVAFLGQTAGLRETLASSLFSTSSSS